MIMNGLIIVILNYIIMGAALLLSFSAFGRITAAAPETVCGNPDHAERIRAQDNSSLQTVA